MLDAVRVKVENPQVGAPYKKLYPLYPLLPITVKLASYRGEQEQRVQRVRERNRFDNTAPEGG